MVNPGRRSSVRETNWKNESEGGRIFYGLFRVPKEVVELQMCIELSKKPFKAFGDVNCLLKRKRSNLLEDEPLKGKFPRMWTKSFGNEVVIPKNTEIGMMVLGLLMEWNVYSLIFPQTY